MIGTVDARTGILAAVARLSAAAVLSTAAAGCGGGGIEAAETRVDLDRLTSALRGQEEKIGRLVTKLTRLEQFVRKEKAALVEAGPAQTAAKAKPRRAESGDASVRSAAESTDAKGLPKLAVARSARRSRTKSDIAFTRKVQIALKNAGIDPGPIDGKKGPLTTGAIKRFQGENNLPDSGKADPDTWALLKRHLP